MSTPIRRRLATKVLLVVGIGFTTLWLAAFILVKAQSNAIIEQQAKMIAETVQERTRALRAVYTREVVGKLVSELPGQVKPTSEHNKPGEIPLPAVFVHRVNEEVNKQATQNKANVLAQSSLISGWNVNKAFGLRDDFEQAGWKYLMDQQEALRKGAGGDPAGFREKLAQNVGQWKSFSRVEKVDGKEMLRFLAPDVASVAGCVNCHNALEQTPEVRAQRSGLAAAKVFELNEIMGALSINVPIELAGTFAAERTQTTLIVLFGIMMVVLASVWLFVQRSVKPVKLLTDAAGRIVHEGDFSQSIDVGNSNDEVGQMAHTFNMLVGKVREILGTLRQSSEMLNGAGAALQSSASEQNQTLSKQAAALQETQVTAQEIKQTSLTAAQKAEAVLKMTQRAEAVGTTGQQAVEQTLNGLSDIRTQVGNIGEKIVALRASAQQIGEITMSVKELADQSNMLALNAAIEAVRSGEHGKGFGIVAREIRSLADQSIQSTARVREILGGIVGSIEDAVRITEEGTSRIDGGLVQVRTSGDNLKELSGIVSENTAAVRQIAATVGQQNAGVSQIFTAVNDMSQMMTETVKRLGGTTAAADNLLKASRQVTELLEKYKV